MGVPAGRGRPAVRGDGRSDGRVAWCSGWPWATSTHGPRLGPAGPALGWLALLALTSQVIGWLLITVSMPRLAAGMIGALLLIQPAGSVALSYLFLDERPSVLQLTGVALMLAGVVIAVSGRAPAVPYSRRRTRIIRQASAASSGRSAPKSP